MLFSVKSIALSSVNVAMIEVGIAREAISTRPEISQEDQHNEAREKAAEQQMLFQGSNRRVDENRLVRNDAEIDIRRKSLLDFLQLGFDEVDDFDRVCSGLTAHIQLYGLLAVDHVPVRRIRELSSTCADVVYADWRSVDVRDDDVAELADRIDSPKCPHAEFVMPRTMRPPGISTFSLWIACWS